MEAHSSKLSHSQRELLAIHEDLQNKPENLNKGLSFRMACLVASKLFTVCITRSYLGEEAENAFEEAALREPD